MAKQVKFAATNPWASINLKTPRAKKTGKGSKPRKGKGGTFGS